MNEILCDIKWDRRKDSIKTKQFVNCGYLGMSVGLIIRYDFMSLVFLFEFLKTEFPHKPRKTVNKFINFYGILPDQYFVDKMFIIPAFLFIVQNHF